MRFGVLTGTDLRLLDRLLASLDPAGLPSAVAPAAPVEPGDAEPAPIDGTRRWPALRDRVAAVEATRQSVGTLVVYGSIDELAAIRGEEPPQ
jgi:hypothetical protein